MDSGLEEEPCNVHKVRVVLPEENVNIGDLCGNNNGQHLYIHLDTNTRRYGQTAPVRIEMEFLGRRKRYQYNIKVEQLDYTDKNDIERMVIRSLISLLCLRHISRHPRDVSSITRVGLIYKNIVNWFSVSGQRRKET